MSKTTIINLLTAINCLNVFDYVMVLPLGPDFAKDLGIPLNDIGIIGASYSFASVISGIILATKIDKFDRKISLLYALTLLCFATFFTIFADTTAELIIMRIIAGVAGGAISSMVTAITIDLFIESQRAKAMGAIMSGFSIAMVIGIPFGLEMSRHFNWHMPFIVVSVVGVLLTVTAYYILPNNINEKRQDGSLLSSITLLLQSIPIRNGLSIIFISNFAILLVVPYLAGFIQMYWQLPRAQLGWLYMVAGTCTFIGMRTAGTYMHNVGKIQMISMVTIVNIIVLYMIGFTTIQNINWLIWVLFPCMVLTFNIRNLIIMLIGSTLPPKDLRGAYSTLQNATSSLASGAGGFVSSYIVQHDLSGFWIVICTSIILGMFLPYLCFRTTALKKSDHYN